LKSAQKYILSRGGLEKVRIFTRIFFRDVRPDAVEINSGDSPRVHLSFLRSFR